MSEQPFPPDPDDHKPHRVALRAMESWHWRFADPDGVLFTAGKEIAVVVSKLAMAGQDDPKADLLELLCEGLLQATRRQPLQHSDLFWRSRVTRAEL